MWVRPGRKTQYQKTTRPPDCLPEYWATIGQHKRRQEIVKWRQRKKHIGEAIAKRNLPRVPVDPSEYSVPAATLQHRPPVTGDENGDELREPLVDDSDDASFVTSIIDSEVDTEQFDNEDIEFCELCHKPAWLHKYCRSKNKIMCQQMFCMFVKKQRNTYHWLGDLVPNPYLYDASAATDTSADDWCSFDHDIPNSAHIDREFGVTQLQRVKAFQRMTVYGTVAKDVPRDKWKTIPKAMEAVAAEWARLRAQNVWDEAHPRTLGSVQAEAKRNNKTSHIGRLFDLCVEKHVNLLLTCVNKGRVVFGGNNVRDE